MNTALKEGVKEALEKHTIPVKLKENTEEYVSQEFLAELEEKEKNVKMSLTEDELNELLEEAKHD